MSKLADRIAIALGSILLVLSASSAWTADRPQMRVVLAGQSMLQSDPRLNSPDAMAAIRPLLEGDVVFTNFETTVKKVGDSLSDAAPRGVVYAPPQAIAALREMGVNLLALSNNHSYDIGAVGILNTLEAVKTAGMAHAGIGSTLDEAAAPGYLQIGNTTIALISMASGLIRPGGFAGHKNPGVNELRVIGGTPGADGRAPDPKDSVRILRSIREAAGKADLVIAYQHNHVYDRDFVKMMVGRMPERLLPAPWTRKWTHEEIDAGADIVVLHGVPLLQGIEIYRGRPIFYDLGNFIFQLPLHYEPSNLFEPNVWESVVARANFDGRKLNSIIFTPIVIGKEGRGEGDLKVVTRGLPAQAHGKTAREILQRLVDAARPMGCEIIIKGDTAQLRVNSPHEN